VNVVDVVYELTDKDAAIWSVFTIDPELELLNTHFDGGDIVLPTDWNGYWRVSTKAPNVDLFNTRFSLADYKKLIDADIPGLLILCAGYPLDDVESMLADRKLQFTRTDYDENGEPVQVPDISLDENGGVVADVRIAPTVAACDRYRELYPETITEEIDDQLAVIKRGNFSRHGL